MSNTHKPQTEKKKTYSTPQLTVYGNVETLTRGRTGTGSSDVASGAGFPRKINTPTPTNKP